MVVVPLNEKAESVPPEKVMVVALSVVASIFCENLTKPLSKFVGMLMLPGNGVVPSTEGGVTFAETWAAPPVVNVIL